MSHGSCVCYEKNYLELFLALNLNIFLLTDKSKALLELGRIDEAIQRHKIEVRVGKQSGISELKIRGMDNLAVRT